MGLKFGTIMRFSSENGVKHLLLLLILLTLFLVQVHNDSPHNHQSHQNEETHHKHLFSWLYQYFQKPLLRDLQSRLKRWRHNQDIRIGYNRSPDIFHQICIVLSCLNR